MNVEEAKMNKLKAKRLKAGMSQSQLADKADLNVRTIQHYEQGSKNFDHARIDTIFKVCLALNCKFEDVVENQDFIDLLDQYNSSSNK